MLLFSSPIDLLFSASPSLLYLSCFIFPAPSTPKIGQVPSTLLGFTKLG